MSDTTQTILTLGYSPCPNDTFIFGGLAGGRVAHPGLTFSHRLHDVETLNRRAICHDPEQRLDISKLSFYAWLKVRREYSLLDCGGALGDFGPVLITGPQRAKQPFDPGARIVAPGEWTTAHLLFRLWAPDAAKRRFATYDRIFEELKAGRADYGLIIHESRFTFEQAGFSRVVDLGEWWRKETGLPIPLGCIAIRRELGAERAAQVEAVIRQSLAVARQDPESVSPYIREHAQEMDRDVCDEHIKAFVNEYSMSLGEKGRRAVETLEARAVEAGIL